MRVLLILLVALIIREVRPSLGARDSEAAMMFIDDLAPRLASRVQLTIDGHKPYLEAIEGAFSPAMAAGVTPKLWEMSDMVKVLEDRETNER